MMDVMRRGGVMLNVKNQLQSLLCFVDQREGQEVIRRNQIGCSQVVCSRAFSEIISADTLNEVVFLKG